MAPEAPTAKPSARKQAKCVICGKPRDPKYDPFCSKRCADVDLNRWFKGSYVIPGGAAKGPEDEDKE